MKAKKVILTVVVIPILMLLTLLNCSKDSAAPDAEPPQGLSGMICFSTERDGNSEIYTMMADGSDQQNLTNTDEINEFNPLFSPDGSQILFRQNSPGSPNYGWYTIDANGQSRRFIFDFNSCVSWHPDGESIVYSDNAPFDGRDELYIYHIDSNNSTRLTHFGDIDCDINEIAVSPDGSKIAFNARNLFEGGSDWEIFTVDINGSNLRQLTTNDDFDCSPQWSHDGSQIAYELSANSVGISVRIMNADGTDDKLLLDGEKLPRWSPDGRFIAYSDDFNCGNPSFPNNTFWEIFVMCADGTNQYQLTSNYCYGSTSPSWKQ